MGGKRKRKDRDPSTANKKQKTNREMAPNRKGSLAVSNYNRLQNFPNNKAQELFNKLRTKTTKEAGNESSVIDTLKEEEIDKQPVKEWYEEKKLSEKSMTPQRKLEKLLLLIVEEKLPESIIVPLKLFFAHTASFVPENNLGRDFRSSQHGTYFRSSNSQIREGNTRLLKEIAESEDIDTKGKTAQVWNLKYYELLKKYANLGKNILEALFPKKNDFAIYTSSQGSRTGSLGLTSNVYKTLQVASDYEKSENDIQSHNFKSSELLRVIGEIKLGQTGNYHDQLIQNRAALVGQLSESIKGMYSAYDANKIKKIRIKPIQSGQHPSLILELQHPSSLNQENTYSEKEWRELFIKKFNAAAEEKELDTRITHRGSFGFLHPTASSVGHPVRIWMGLTPAPVIAELLEQTLNSLGNDESFKEIKVKLNVNIKENNPIHREALKTAVRYVQDVVEAIGEKVSDPKKLVDWLTDRLLRNLHKAKHILEVDYNNLHISQKMENDYLKSALVIENLMEYSYILEGMRVNNDLPEDPYPTYLREELGLSKTSSSKTSSSKTFYLDSGMQAITMANIVALNHIQTVQGSDQSPVHSVNLYSYFEYGMIDKRNLKLIDVNKVKEGEQPINGKNFKERFETKLNKGKPSVISIDVNPVFTDAAQNDNQIPYDQVLELYQTKESKDSTIPILDITNGTLQDVAKLELHKKYPSFIIVESLSKHQQLSADKFTMGRISVIGDQNFVKRASELLEPIQKDAHHPLLEAYRLRMDRVYLKQLEENDSQASKSYGLSKRARYKS
ncbi:hypothetical protein LVD15_00845 [Fulvivirga maritima]|uniref:hypothetical protein n=1 Tax=Fulvivirga maritima TaxID=2904247 RepID=UPI001F1B294C|nr:hypothetical protein [Fulvivirga maritima]UII27016.1 hypothetical protein LVD15_00845 [Fulvivirga maritima]